jgi:GDP-L-fucose synthase
MKVLITGCNGFLGKEIKDFFSDKYELYLTNRQTLDMLDKQSVTSFIQDNKIEAVIHTAVSGCGGSTDTFTDFSNNITMFKNLYDNRDKFKIMINFGSGAEFNRASNIYYNQELDIFRTLPEDYYGLAKNMITREILKTDNIFSFRIFGCFGKHEKDTRFIKNSLSRLDKGLPIKINQNRYMDYVYVKDVCLLVEHYLQNYDKKQLYKDVNMCYSENTTLLDIANCLLSIKGLSSEVEINNPKLGTYYCGDGDRLKQFDIDFYGIERGLQEVING